MAGGKEKHVDPIKLGSHGGVSVLGELSPNRAVHAGTGRRARRR
jgi:hypothetical protein